MLYLKNLLSALILPPLGPFMLVALGLLLLGRLPRIGRIVAWSGVAVAIAMVAPASVGKLLDGLEDILVLEPARLAGSRRHRHPERRPAGLFRQRRLPHWRPTLPAQGDLVFTQRGTLGQVSEVPSQPYARYLISQSQMKVTLDPKIGVPSFYYYFFSSPARQEVIRRSAIQTGVPHINLGILRQFAVKVPPISEQRSIAAALSDVDSLLAKLEQLIAKKRDLKQAAMQQLFTGRIRISGFTGEWQPTRLGDLANLTMGRTPSRRVQAYWGSGYMWASIADMQTKVLRETAEQITEAGASGVPIIPAGTLLMSFKLSIGRLAFAGCDLFTNEAICAFRKLKANASFLYYALFPPTVCRWLL